MKITIDIDATGDKLKFAINVEANEEEYIELAKKSPDENYESIFQQAWMESGKQLDAIIHESVQNACKEEACQACDLPLEEITNALMNAFKSVKIKTPELSETEFKSRFAKLIKDLETALKP